MTAISITKAAFALVQARLESLGFEKRKPAIFSSAVSDEVIGWIGLNKALRGSRDTVEVNPVVGVRNQRIEQVVAELTGDAYNDLIPPTVAGNVGYLSPTHQYQVFKFSEAGPNEEIADQLYEAIEAHGLPFMKRVADLRRLVESMQTARFGISEQLNYRIPVGLWLLADVREAKAFIAAKLSEVGTRGDLAAQRYRAFAMKLDERMDH
jgi:hypothetical protein